MKPFSSQQTWSWRFDSLLQQSCWRRKNGS